MRILGSPYPRVRAGPRGGDACLRTVLTPRWVDSWFLDQWVSMGTSGSASVRDDPGIRPRAGRPLAGRWFQMTFGRWVPNPLICTRFHSLQGGILYDSRYSSVCGILIVFHIMAVVKGGIGSLTDVGAVPRRLGWESCRVISLALLCKLPTPHCCVGLCPEVQSRFNTWDTPSVHMCSSATSSNVR